MEFSRQYTLEFPIRSSIKVLYKRLSTPSGLSEWFANDVNIKNGVYTFYWDGSEQSAKLVTKKENKFVKYKWVDSDEADDYFEFKIVVDDMTSDVSLLITDFADDEEDFEEAKLLWETQVDNLRGALGL
jgi:hypothetical protein|tara:strand:- start:87 stop:473 length:387 start_codon:yes stop_codon:yes gene_type:complete